MKTGEAVRHEIIGLTVKITKAKNQSLVGLSGVVLDETRNSFVIEKEGKRKTILKNQITELMIGNVRVGAKHLMKRPEERIKGEKK
jgi:ribonuclease P protein subunit POP4